MVVDSGLSFGWGLKWRAVGGGAGIWYTTWPNCDATGPHILRQVLSGGAESDAGRSVPVRAELLELHDRGADGARGGEGDDSGALADFAVPSVREVGV